MLASILAESPWFRIILALLMRECQFVACRYTPAPQVPEPAGMHRWDATATGTGRKCRARRAPGRRVRTRRGGWARQQAAGPGTRGASRNGRAGCRARARGGGAHAGAGRRQPASRYPTMGCGRAATRRQTTPNVRAPDAQPKRCGRGRCCSRAKSTPRPTPHNAESRPGPSPDGLRMQVHRCAFAARHFAAAPS